LQAGHGLCETSIAEEMLMNIALSSPSCIDDIRIRVNVSRTASDIAIACVINDRRGCPDVYPPILLAIKNAHQTPASASAGQGRESKASREDLRTTLGTLLLKALKQGYTGCDPFVRHVTLALYAMCSGRAPGEVQADEAVPGGLKPWQKALSEEVLGGDTASASSLAEAAQRCGLSTAHFCRAFTKSFGLPPYRWMLTRRLEKAKALLMEPDRTLADIAYECGFCDQSHLNHAFSRLFGISPGAWRKLAPPCGNSLQLAEEEHLVL
jgi:AraC-like DNA-binding protein